jgi:hypothetical protein
MIAIETQNGIIYPVDVYMKYNLYLIDRCSKFSDFVARMDISDSERDNHKAVINCCISQLNSIYVNKGQPSVAGSVNICIWEENLNTFYRIINRILLLYECKPLLTIETFLRYQKLNKIKNL